MKKADIKLVGIIVAVFGVFSIMGVAGAVSYYGTYQILFGQWIEHPFAQYAGAYLPLELSCW